MATIMPSLKVTTKRYPPPTPFGTNTGLGYFSNAERIPEKVRAKKHTTNIDDVNADIFMFFDMIIDIFEKLLYVGYVQPEFEAPDRSGRRSNRLSHNPSSP